MLEFVNWLRLIATILITNSHYSNIWPISALAFGGLLGNVIFFAVSGYCLFTVKGRFGTWYLRRIVKVVPVAVVFTLATVIAGLYPIRGTEDFVRYFVFPTNYVFLVWLVILYVPYYFWARRAGTSKTIAWGVPVALTVAWIVTYVAFVPKNAYVVDDVSSPFILFLYFCAMLMGGLFRKNAEREIRLSKKSLWLVLVALALYLVSKLAFERIKWLTAIQILNQFVILGALLAIFRFFIGLEPQLVKAPKWVKKIVAFVSARTLHIYVVQFVVIRAFSKLTFPINFLIVTALILVGATILKFLEDVVRRCVQRLVARRAYGKA